MCKSQTYQVEPGWYRASSLLSLLTFFFSFWFWSLLLQLSHVHTSHVQVLIQKVWGGPGILPVPKYNKCCWPRTTRRVPRLQGQSLLSSALTNWPPWSGPLISSFQYNTSFQYNPGAHSICFLLSSVESADPFSLMRLILKPPDLSVPRLALLALPEAVEVIRMDGFSEEVNV